MTSSPFEKPHADEQQMSGKLLAVRTHLREADRQAPLQPCTHNCDGLAAVCSVLCLQTDQKLSSANPPWRHPSGREHSTTKQSALAMPFVEHEKNASHQERVWNPLTCSLDFPATRCWQQVRQRVERALTLLLSLMKMPCEFPAATISGH
jgi:hypothetical protein